MGISTTFLLKFNGAAVQKGLSKIRNSYRGMEKSVMQFGKSLVTNFAKFAAIAAPIAVTAGFLAFAKSSSEAASSIEDLTMQFETLTKSAKITKDLIADMKKDAAKSQLSIEDYAQAGKTLMAFGMEAKEVMPTLKDLADVSMGNAERFGSLALAFAQTQAAGRLMGQEVLQFVNAGFNPLQQISKRTGETMVQLKKRMEDGAVSSKEVAQAFKEATMEGGLFYKAIERGALTTRGKIAKTKDSILSVRIAFGTGFNDGLKVALDAMNKGIPKLEGLAGDMGKQIGFSIAEAVEGDTDRLVAIGVMIGKAMKGGIKVGLTSATMDVGEAFWKTMEDTNPFVKTANKVTGVKASDYITKNKSGAVQAQLSATIERARADFANIKNTQPRTKLPTGPVPGLPGFDFAGPNDSTSLRAEFEGKMIRVVETIARHLSPQP